MQETIRNNIDRVLERAAKAAQRAGRDPKDITLIAVSKMHPAEDVEAAAACGVLNFGENKVQELLSKQPLVEIPVRWHLIGHLQTNKVRQAVGKVVLIHSVDSMHLVEEIDKRSAAAGIVSDILIQVNAAQEESKFGVGLNEAEALALQAAEEFKPEFIAIANSPVPWLIGTDFRSICSKIKEKTGIPTFHVGTNAMHDYTVGAGDAFRALAEGAGR